MTTPDATVRAAYAACRRIARRHYENFPVASWLVPKPQRDALAAIYGFARYADDLADEPGIDHRLRRLDEWRRKLGACYAGRADHPAFLALRDAAERFALSLKHFEDLLRAFELDVKVQRHPDFNSLLSYCSCSANPVGRLVLELFGHREPDLFALSDNICTALQLTNFWQDVAVDSRRGRVYIPLEDLERFRYSLADLAAARTDERWRGLMRFEVERARELFERGRPLAGQVVRELRVQLRLTWLGGMTILDKVEAADFDVFRRRPSLRGTDFVRLYFKARRKLDGRAEAAVAPGSVASSNGGRR